MSDELAASPVCRLTRHYVEHDVQEQGSEGYCRCQSNEDDHLAHNSDSLVEDVYERCLRRYQPFEGLMQTDKYSYISKTSTNLTTSELKFFEGLRWLRDRANDTGWPR